MNPKPSQPFAEIAARLKVVWSRLRSGHGVMVLAYLVGLVLLMFVTLSLVGVVGSGGSDGDDTDAGAGVDMIEKYPNDAFPADAVYRLKSGGQCLTVIDGKPGFGEDDCRDVTVFAVERGVFRFAGDFGGEHDTCLAATGATVTAAACADSSDQTLVTIPTTKTAYSLATAATGKCLVPSKGGIELTECDFDGKTQLVTLDKQDTAPNVFPVTGSYTVRAGHSKLCLGEGPEPKAEPRNILVQQDCGAKSAGLTFQPDKADKFAIEVDNVKENWANCLAADPPGDALGYLFGATDCAGKNPGLRTFTLKPYGGGVFRILVSESGLCMGIKDRRSEAGVQADMTECVPGRKSQLFTLTLADPLPTKPQKFGAWWSDKAREWGAKWERPATDGGQHITGYLLEDCDGNELLETDASTFTADIPEPADGCLTVRSLTKAGPGTPARYLIKD